MVGPSNAARTSYVLNDACTKLIGEEGGGEFKNRSTGNYPFHPSRGAYGGVSGESAIFSFFIF